MNSIFFLSILLLSFTNHTDGFFLSRNTGQRRPIITKGCCIPPKFNVNSQKANVGKDLLRQLTTDSDLYEEVNPDKICDLMHFFFQQASMNEKLISFTEGMFIIFDSSNRFFDRLIKLKKSQTTSKPFKFRQHLPPHNPLKYVGRRSIQTAFMNTSVQNVISDERYPTYGIDIPNSCLPSNYDHVLIGELPPFTEHVKYRGRRLFIKPERFGFDKTKILSAMNDLNGFAKQLVQQQLCRLVKGETTAECAKLRAFKENIDKIILKKWKKILSKLPSKWKIDKNYKERAIKYGIREIDQQSKDLEATGAGKMVKQFRKILLQKYGQDVKARKGREIILTIDELRQGYTTCETPSSIKCRF